MSHVRKAAPIGAALFFLFPLPQSVEAQQDAPLTFVVTPGRVEQSIQRVGSAVTVITARDIEKSNPTTMAELLRGSPGLAISETGGPGATTLVRLRGANSGQTLVLIDGVRVNDSSSASGEFDFSMISPSLIERIEILRGPQSALYGSEAIGGVINIITKRGSGPARWTAQAEGGSYGTASGSLGVSGSQADWSYAFGVSGQRSDGFSSYGHRVRRIEAVLGRLEPDGLARFGGFGRVGYDPGNGFRLTVSGLASVGEADFDASFGARPDTPDVAERRLYQGSVRAEYDAFEGRWRHSLEVFANRNDRTFRENRAPSRVRDDFVGDRFGVEYQSTLGLDRFGSLTAGARYEVETGRTFNERLAPAPTPRVKTLAERQETRSAFALWQLPLTNRLDVSLGGRIDDVRRVGSFTTWRATAAYRIEETGTKLRASAGTGAKAPTLFQLYSPNFGNAALRPEKSEGFDVGFDQTFPDGRTMLSVTAFHNRFSNMIGFQNNRYVNVERARTRGVEASLDTEIVPEFLRARASWTYLESRDLRTGLKLARRPTHSGSVTLTITPDDDWTIEPSVVFTSAQFSGGGQTGRLAPWARLDVRASYRVNPGLELYARVENVTDARYQDVLNYGTAGRSVYAGLRANW